MNTFGSFISRALQGLRFLGQFRYCWIGKIGRKPAAVSEPPVRMALELVSSHTSSTPPIAVIVYLIDGADKAHAMLAVDRGDRYPTYREMISRNDDNTAVAVVDALQHLDQWSREEQVHVIANIAHPVVASWLQENHGCFEFLTPAGEERSDRQRALFHESLNHLRQQLPKRRRKASQVVVDIAPHQPLLIATDASVRHNRKGAGIAYITSTGEYQQDYVTTTTDISALELAAVLLAVSGAKEKSLVILCDNQNVVRWLNGVSQPTNRRRMNLLARIEERTQGREVQFQWVRAHQGHVLNETADRLAVAARRNVEAGVSAETRARIVSNILSDMQVALGTTPNNQHLRVA